MTRRFEPIAARLLAASLAFLIPVAPALAADGEALAQASPQAKTQKQERLDRKDERREKAETTVAHVPELRDETFRLMDAYMISNIQESLGLTDDQFAKVLPLVKRLQSERRDRAMRRLKALRVLRRSLNSGSATESSVADLLKELKSATLDERDTAARNIEALDSVLNPLQQAKYRVFEAEVDARLRHLLARIQDKDKPAPR